MVVFISKTAYCVEYRQTKTICCSIWCGLWNNSFRCFPKWLIRSDYKTPNIEMLIRHFFRELKEGKWSNKKYVHGTREWFIGHKYFNTNIIFWCNPQIFWCCQQEQIFWCGNKFFDAANIFFDADIFFDAVTTPLDELFY